MTSGEERATAVHLDDERLAAYVEGCLTGPAIDEVERHLEVCGDCLDVVAACTPMRSAPHAGPVAASGDSRAPRPSRAAGIRHRWALAASLVLILGGLLVIAAEHPFHGLGRGLSQVASRWFGTSIAVDAVALRIGGPGTFVVHLRDVQLGGTEDLFRADEVDVTVALANLASGNPPVRQLRLVRPVVEVAKPERLGVALSLDHAGHVLATLGDVERVEVVDGEVRVRGTTERLDGVTGSLERAADGAKVALQGRAGAGVVTVEGDLRAEPGGSSMTIAARDVDAAVVPGLPRGLHGTTLLRADVTSADGAIRVDGRLAVRNGRVAGRGLRRLLDDDTAALVAAAAPALVADDLAFEEASAVVRWRTSGWRLPRFFVSFGNTVAGGRARLEKGVLTGHGTVRVSAELATALAAHLPSPTTDHDRDAATLPFVISGSADAPHLALGTR